MGGMMVTCEIKSREAWMPIGVQQAYELPPGTMMRCISCHGAVHLYPATKGSGASVPHFGHNKAHPGCPHSMHPEPLK